ncbi:uncharacterized protein [Panulirus ornatus]|uniref:uncharacterized protein n=1 Tax=Panulirus ornatus TaxID=150431 RepID=UPI003A8A3B07
MADEDSRDAGLTDKEEIERVMKVTLDRLHREIDERFIRLHDTDGKFGFLLSIMLTIAVSMASCERSFSKMKLILSYLRASMGQDRLCDLALLSVEKETEKTDFEQIKDQFASVKARKIMLTIAVSMASCERSFSKMKLILSYLRASMGQDRLCDLALLSVEKETEKTDFEQIKDQFASVKARKVQL